MSTRINNNNFDKNNIICGCKGIRFCAYCLDSDRIISKNIAKDLSPYNGHKCFIFNPRDRKAHYIPSLFYNSSLVEIYAEINSKSTNHVCTMQCTDELDGVLILEDFISVNEEQSLIEQIDKSEWKFSQSGRLKQDFGPQVNFKQKKIKMDQFKGLPKYTDILLDKINDLNCEKLSGFFPVELCNLDYSPKRLSSIDMHIDDQWIWGERLISINMLSDSLITLQNLETNLLVFLPLYRRSLLCLSGTQRHLWEHSIFAHHVTERRVVITLREAAQGFLEGGEHEEIGRELFNRSQRRIDV